MKKIIAFILLISCINIFNPFIQCFADDKINLKTEKNKNISALIEKDTNKEILPYKYNKIRKIKYDKKTVYIGETSDYITLYSPDGMYSDFLENYFKSNKYNSNILFKNYPSKAVIRYVQDKKFGLILAETDKLHITKPVYEKIIFPDEKSYAARFLDISFAPEDMVIAYSGNYRFQTLKQILENDPNYYNKRILPEPAKIQEEVIFNNNTFTVEYKGFEYFNGTIEIPTNYEIKYDTDIYTPYVFYNTLNSTENYNFIDYPANVVIKDGYHIYPFENTLKYIITVPASDFYIENSIFKAITGVEASFSNGENIIAKHGAWGIINKSNEIKVPFIYDELYPLTEKYRERFYCTEYSPNCKLNIQFIPLKSEQELFLAKKGYSWGIIDENNNVKVPFENKHLYSDSEVAKLKTEMNKKIKSDYAAEERERAIHNIPFFILDMLLLPLWLITPASSGVHAYIHFR